MDRPSQHHVSDYLLQHRLESGRGARLKTLVPFPSLLFQTIQRASRPLFRTRFRPLLGTFGLVVHNARHVRRLTGEIRCYGCYTVAADVKLSTYRRRRAHQDFTKLCKYLASGLISLLGYVTSWIALHHLHGGANTKHNAAKVDDFGLGFTRNTSLRYGISV